MRVQDPHNQKIMQDYSDYSNLTIDKQNNKADNKS